MPSHGTLLALAALCACTGLAAAQAAAPAPAVADPGIADPNWVDPNLQTEVGRGLGRGREGSSGRGGAAQSAYACMHAWHARMQPPAAVGEPPPTARTLVCRPPLLQGFQASLTPEGVAGNPLGLVPVSAAPPPALALVQHHPRPGALLTVPLPSLALLPQAQAQAEGMDLPNGGVTFSSQHNAEVSLDAENLWTW